MEHYVNTPPTSTGFHFEIQAGNRGNRFVFKKGKYPGFCARFCCKSILQEMQILAQYMCLCMYAQVQ